MIARSPRPRLRGVFCALTTPFFEGRIDLSGLSLTLERAMKQGVRGFVACSATGEASTLSIEERCAVIRRCVDVVDGQALVIAGTGTNDTRRTIALTRLAADLGADAALLAAPYYNRPGQEGLFRHYEAICAATDMALIVDNAPSRAGVDVTPDLLERLAALPGIVAVCDATGSISRAEEIIERFGESFALLGSHDVSALAWAAAGADGIVSDVANLAPGETAAMFAASVSGDLAMARRIHARLAPLVAALDREISPCALKYGLSLTGSLSGEVRLPLLAAEPKTADAVRRAMADLAKDDECASGHEAASLRPGHLSPRDPMRTHRARGQDKALSF